MNLKRVLAAAILTAMVLAPAAWPQVKTTSDRDAAVAEKWIAAWNSHDPDKMLPVFTDDVFYEDVAYGEVSHGHAEFRKFAADEFEAVPDLELKLKATAPSNGRLAVPTRGSTKRERSSRSEA